MISRLFSSLKGYYTVEQKEDEGEQLEDGLLPTK